MENTRFIVIAKHTLPSHNSSNSAWSMMRNSPMRTTYRATQMRTVGMVRRRRCTTNRAAIGTTCQECGKQVNRKQVVMMATCEQSIALVHQQTSYEHQTTMWNIGQHETYRFYQTGEQSIVFDASTNATRKELDGLHIPGIQSEQQGRRPPPSPPTILFKLITQTRRAISAQVKHTIARGQVIGLP